MWDSGEKSSLLSSPGLAAKRFMRSTRATQVRCQAAVQVFLCALERCEGGELAGALSQKLTRFVLAQVFDYARAGYLNCKVLRTKRFREVSLGG